MTDQADRQAVHGSLRDLLRALERDGDDWTSNTKWEGPPRSGGILPSLRSDDSPEQHAKGDVDWMAHWWDWIGQWSPAAVMSLVVPVMGLLFFSALLAAPTGANWGKVQRLDAASDQPAHSGQEPASQNGVVQAFAMLGQRAFSIAPNEPMTSEEARNGQKSEDIVALPFAETSEGLLLPASEIEEQLPPPNAEMSAAQLTTASEPSVMPAASVPASPPRSRPKEIGSGWMAAITVPVPGTQVLTIQDPQQSQSAGSTWASQDWLQPWNHSSLGLAY